MCLACLLGIRAPDDIGAVVDRALGVEGALLAGETLHEELGVGALVREVSELFVVIEQTAWT